MLKRRYQVDLPADMAQCELNYARLQRLLHPHASANVRERARAWQSCELGIGDDVRIALAVIERGPYTTTLGITQLAGGATALLAPRLSVRVYHDAQLAEVVEFSDRRRVWPRYDYPNADMYQPDEKAQWNRFLGDWLSLCLHQGWARERSLPVL